MKLKRSRNEWVWKSQHSKSMSILAIRLESMMARSKATKVKSITLTKPEAKLKSWFQCLVVKHQLNSISYKLKKSKGYYGEKSKDNSQTTNSGWPSQPRAASWSSVGAARLKHCRILSKI